MPTLEDFYIACEDAIRCQAGDQPLGVVSSLRRAALLRDQLLHQARARVENHIVQTILQEWDNTLKSLPYAASTGEAKMYYGWGPPVA